MKILFCPSDIGGGHGHLSRCLAIADEAAKRNIEIAFILHNPLVIKSISKLYKVFSVNWHKFSVKIIKSIYEKVVSKKNKPLYTYIPSLNYQVIRDGFFSTKDFSKAFSQYDKIIDIFKPDVIIGDTNLIIGPIAQKHKVKIIQLVRKGSWYKSPQIIWWELIKKEACIPDIKNIFNPVLEKFNIDPISKAEDLLKGDIYLVPSIPEFEPINDDTVKYLGALLREDKLYVKNINFENLSSKPIIYVSIGGGALNIGSINFFNFIIDAYKNTEYNVYISTASVIDAKKIKNQHENIHFYNWLPGKKIIEAADLVVFHGGYGTMMETVIAQKPSIIIPFHSEQESNGRRLIQNGLGELCELSSEDYSVKEYTFLTSKFTTLSKSKFTLNSDELIYKSEKIFQGIDNYQEQGLKIKTKCIQYHWPDIIFDDYCRI